MKLDIKFDYFINLNSEYYLMGMKEPGAVYSLNNDLTNLTRLTVQG